MSRMSEIDYDRQIVDTIRREVEDDMGEEPRTPKELAQYNVERATRDAWLAMSELVKLRNDPIARPFFTSRIEGDLWSIKGRVDLIIGEIRAENGEPELPRQPILKVISNG